MINRIEQEVKATIRKRKGLLRQTSGSTGKRNAPRYLTNLRTMVKPRS